MVFYGSLLAVTATFSCVNRLSSVPSKVVPYRAALGDMHQRRSLSLRSRRSRDATRHSTVTEVLVKVSSVSAYKLGTSFVSLRSLRIA